MKIKILLVFALALIFAAGPLYAGHAVQMWSCGIEDGVEEDDIEARAAEWLAAARGVEGGANLNAYVMFPVVVNASGETDMMFVVSAPNFTEWGTFWDAYPDSDAAQGEDDGIFCPDSVLWDSTKVE